MSNTNKFPDQPAEGELDAGQLKDGKPAGRKAEDLPDGGGDDEELGEDEAPPE